jgi:hypothetical protein
MSRTIAPAANALARFFLADELFSIWYYCRIGVARKIGAPKQPRAAGMARGATYLRRNDRAVRSARMMTAFTIDLRL